MLDGDALAEIAGDQEAVYRMAGYDPGDRVSIGELCEKLIGSRPEAAPLLRTEGVLARVGDAQRIFTRQGLSPARARWRAGHELAHVYYDRTGYHGLDLEERCDALGAALVAPRRVVIELRRRRGSDPLELAKALRTTQSLALLRLGECCGDPVALVRGRGGAIVRGEEIVWPQLDLARAKRLQLPGLRRVAIDDEPRRLGLLVEDVGDVG